MLNGTPVRKAIKRTEHHSGAPCNWDHGVFNKGIVFNTVHFLLEFYALKHIHPSSRASLYSLFSFQSSCVVEVTLRHLQSWILSTVRGLVCNMTQAYTMIDDPPSLLVVISRALSCTRLFLESDIIVGRDSPGNWVVRDSSFMRYTNWPCVQVPHGVTAWEE